MHSPISYTYRQLAALGRFRQRPKIWALAIELKGVLGDKSNPGANAVSVDILPVALNTGAIRPVLPDKDTGLQCSINFCIILN